MLPPGAISVKPSAVPSIDAYQTEKPQLLVTDAEPRARAVGARASSTAAPENMVECILLAVVCRGDVEVELTRLGVK